MKSNKILILGAIIILGLAMRSQFAILVVNGASMSPTYEDGDIIVLRQKREYNVGDLIIFEAPATWSDVNYRRPFLKRVAGVSEDVIYNNENGLIIDGEVIRKNNTCKSSSDVLEIEEGNLFVLGDNKHLSNDSYSQWCSGNDDVLIDENSIIYVGTEVFRIGGWR